MTPLRLEKAGRLRAFERLRVIGAVALLVSNACGNDGGPTSTARAPEISIAGVTDGAVYEAPVTIIVSVDVGTYSAKLNGEGFLGSTTVDTPGSYVLDVEAHNAGKSSSVSIAFELRFGGDGVLILRVFDLGENENGGGGDALLISDSTAAGQRHVLVDAGPAGPGGIDAGFVADRLEALGVDTLDALVLTHAHADHFGGMGAVLDRVHVRFFYYNGQVRNFAAYQTLIAQAQSESEQRVTVVDLVQFDLGTSLQTRLRILPPLNTYLSDANAGSTQLNDGSLGVRVSRGAFSLFIAGDGEVEANLRWRTAYPDDTRDLTALKVGHHGANDATFDNGSFGASAWLDHTDPELQLISANGTSHPRIRALTALLARAAQTFCTPVHGEIEVRVDAAGTTWTVGVQRNAGADCVPGRDATT